MADQAGDVACLRLGLVGGVTVQIEAVAVGAGIVGTAVRVLIGHDDDDQVVQNLVHAHLLILAERVVLAGIGAAVVAIAVDGGSADFQSVAGEGVLGAAVIALQREVHDLGIVHPHVHLFAAGQTGDGVPGHRVLGGQGAQQVGVGIYAAGLIGVAVVHHDGHAVIHAALNGLQHGLGVGLGLGIHLFEALNGLGAVGHHGIPLVAAVSALAEGLHVEIAAIRLGQPLNLHQLMIQLVIADVALIDVNLHRSTSQLLPVHAGGQLIVTDKAGPDVACVAEGVAADGLQGVRHQGQSFILHVEKDPMAELLNHGDKAIPDGEFRLLQRKIRLAVGAVLVDVAPAHPIFQIVTGIDIGIVLRTLNIYLVTGQAPLDGVRPVLPLIIRPVLLLLGHRDFQGGNKGFLALIQSEERIVQGQGGALRRGLCHGGQRQHG